MTRAALVALAAAGCAGPAAGEAGARVPLAAASAEDRAPAPTPVRRLTRVEYENSVRDLLGAVEVPAGALPEDQPGPSGFLAPAPVTALDFRRLVRSAEAIADAATVRLAALLPCDPAAAADARAEDACAATFVDGLARRAYRRRPTRDELASLHALYAQARGASGLRFRDAIRVVVAAVLQSPGFLYHWQRVDADGGLDGESVAERLAYFLWASPPDAALAAAVAEGRLRTADDVDAQARRMLRDPRAARGLGSFHRQWLDVDRLDTVQKDANVYPLWGRRCGGRWRPRWARSRPTCSSAATARSRRC